MAAAESGGSWGGEGWPLKARDDEELELEEIETCAEPNSRAWVTGRAPGCCQVLRAKEF